MLELIRQAYLEKTIFTNWLTTTLHSPDVTSLAALTGMLTALILLCRELWVSLRPYIPTYPKEQNFLAERRKERIANLYQRIYNVSVDSPQFPIPKPSCFSHYSNSESSYNRAIKLIQSGVDASKLVDFCNLTVGEAELLSAMYGNLCGTA